MPKAITLTDFGGPDVLRWTNVPLPQPGEGQIRVKVKAAGVGPRRPAPPGRRRTAGSKTWP
ncbi:hypothetical protein ABT215_21805, partial [Streptomyces sp900105755]